MEKKRIITYVFFICAFSAYRFLAKLLPLAPNICTATKSNKHKHDHQSHDPSTKHFTKGRGRERDARIPVQNTSVPKDFFSRTSVPKDAENRPWTARNFNVSVCT
jgi:hypothetical protein